MAGTPPPSDQSQYACKCLNIRIRPGHTDSVADLVEDPNFAKVFVGEEGIIVAHPQVTVRTRTRGVPIAGTSQFSRYTTITCLLCDLLVYRVYQTYSADMEGKVGPILPTEDWVERDILRSLSGWIEVHKDCLNRAAVERAILSETYWSTFGLILPPVVSPSPSFEPIFQRPSSPSSESPPPSPPRFFSNVPPVFLPPPFSPSHPVFTYLASFAAKESLATREAAEVYMTEQMELKTSEIENADAELRKKVNALWTNFREHLSRIQQEKAQPSVRRPSSGSRERAINGVEPMLPGASIRDFAPSRAARARSSSPPAPRVSALSASLATSSFHYPRGRSTETSPPDRPHSNMSNGSPQSVSTLGSSTVFVPQSTDGINVLKMRRNMTEGIDTAASYRFFSINEQEMLRLRGRRKSVRRTVGIDFDQTQQDGGTHASGSKSANSEKSVSRTHQPAPESEGEAKEVSPSRGGENAKGKTRKVTFNVNPAVVTIKREVVAEQAEIDASNKQGDSDMLFELEDLEHHNDEDPNETKPTLQLLEQASQPARRPRRRPQNPDNLTSSFSGLRPMSLPVPSHIRPPRSQHGSDMSSPAMMLSLPKLSLPSRAEAAASGSTATLSNSRPQTANSTGGYTTPPPDPKILQFVAADTPSHRGAWKQDSKAWQTFVTRQPPTHEASAIPEEPEEGSMTDTSGFAVPGVMPRRYDTPDAFVGSLPIPIKVAKQGRTVLSLASYQPTILGAIPNPAPPTAHKQQSSTSIRKAIYAKRDQLRTLDPGPLDFTTEDDDEEEEEEEEEDFDGETINISSVGGRSRKAALNILKARSEMPEEGMWRSLAT